MTRRYVRLTLFVLLFLALGAAAWQIVLLERSLKDVDDRAAATARAAAASIDALLDIRASERAFLAEGQSASYWQPRVERALARLGESLSLLRSAAASQPELFAATDDALPRLLQVERRIGQHALAGRRPHAEDLMFADALEASLAVERDVRAASDTLAAASRDAMRDLRERELIVAALAAAVSLLAALLLLPIRQPAAEAATATAPEPPRADDLPLNLHAPSRRQAPAVTIADAAKTDAAGLPAAPTVPSGPGVAALGSVGRSQKAEHALLARLAATADLCTAIARVRDSGDLPALMAHITRVLDAQGAIVWMADPAQRRLAPALSHGYRDEALARLGTIPWASQNPVADAFRRREARAVEGSGGAPGALVVPLLAGTECAGVVTVELRTVESKAGEPVDNSAPDSTSLDLARIFAAQLASLVAPPPAENAGEATREAAEPARVAGAPIV